MRRIEKTRMLWIGMALALVAVTVAGATPTPNSAVVMTRIFNDCPGSNLNVTNNYPTCITISDQNVGCVGFANLHVWRFSEDGATAAVFNNGDSFSFSADLTISGTGDGEAGLQIAPWWSQNVDGRFNVRSTDGEVACFGGRLPFYSFTGSQGVVYVKGTTIHLEIVYLPNGLSNASPATIEYKLTYNATNYTSGPLAFDEGNPAEDPPYGLWGMLNDARVGGYFQFFVAGSGATGQAQVNWCNVLFQEHTVGVEEQTWSGVKTLFR